MISCTGPKDKRDIKTKKKIDKELCCYYLSESAWWQAFASISHASAGLQASPPRSRDKIDEACEMHAKACRQAKIQTMKGKNKLSTMDFDFLQVQRSARSFVGACKTFVSACTLASERVIRQRLHRVRTTDMFVGGKSCM